MARFNFRSGEAANAQIGRRRLASLAPDRFAFARGEGGEKVVKTGVTAIKPVILHAVANEHARIGAGGAIAVLDEIDVKT